MQKLCFAFLLTAVVGCGGGETGPTLVPATGTVYYKDQPLSGAIVTFQIEGAPLATGTTNASGEFSITTGGRPGCPLGDAKVGIVKTSEEASDMMTMKPEDMQKMAEEGMASGGSQGPKNEIPTKYGNPKSSGLVATLDANGDSNVFEFRLVD